MDLKVSLTGQVGLLNGLAQADRIAQAEQRVAMDTALRFIQHDAQAGVKKDTRNLMASIFPTIQAQSTTTVIGTIGPHAGYGLPVERGRQPGRWPPFHALQLWGSRHGFITRSQVFLLRRAIARRPIRAAPFLIPAYLYNRQRIIDLFRGVGAAVVFRIAQGGRGGFP